MSLTSVTFLLFVLALTVVYFLVPKKYQWTILLAGSIIFYLSTGVKNIAYILITAFSTYMATLYMQKVTDEQKKYFKENKATLTKEEKSEIKKLNTRKRKMAMIAVLALNFGLLAMFKYVVFFMETINSLVFIFNDRAFSLFNNLIMPLGISFYTFQTMGYLVDVYWGKYDAEKNFFKLLLFVSFFPQITQGPISDYKKLTDDLFSEHEFTYRNYSYGVQRMMWGFYKKIAIADLIAPSLYSIFADYSHLSGIGTLCWAFLYSVQLYADFSGYMDIVCGMSEIWGIHLTENFNTPYFSKSVSEYWRRWHMSLGTWFKTYIYYPIAVSKWNKNLSKTIQKKLNVKAQTFSATLALIAVWLFTGLWHGATWGYVLWGGLNGMFVILAMWLEPVYRKTRSALKINEQNPLWGVFQIARTFTLTTFIKVLPDVGTLSDGIGFLGNIFKKISVPFSSVELMPNGMIDFCFIALGIVLMFIADIIKTKGSIRDWLQERPAIIRWGVFIVIFMMTIICNDPMSAEAGGFMYAQF